MGRRSHAVPAASESSLSRAAIESVSCGTATTIIRQFMSQYQGIDNTIVQLFFSCSSVLIIRVARFSRDAHREEYRKTI